MVTEEIAIKVRGVSHQFGEAGEQRFVRALLDTSLDVLRGELLCLIGPSGCGKSTLLNVIGGLTQASAGTVDVLGKPVRGRGHAISPSCFRRMRCFRGTRSSRTSSSA